MLIDNFYFSIFYNLIYFFTAVMILMLSLYVEVNRSYLSTRKLSNILVFLPVILLISLLGSRDFNVGTDTYTYYQILWLTDSRIEIRSEFLFFLIAKILKYFNLSYSYFLFVISSLFTFIMGFFVRRVSTTYRVNSLFVFFAYMSMFFFLSLSINIIRQGVSLACLLLAYSYFINKESKLKLILSILASLAFHSSSIIPLLIFALIVFSRNTIIKDKFYYLVFILFIVLSYLDFGLLDIAPTLMDFLGSDNRRGAYLSGDDSDYSIGFRLDFIVFNTLFLLISIYAKSIIIDKDFKDIYSTIFRYYIAASCLFFMSFQLPYSDRWGLFSWIVIPLIMSPLLYSTSVKSGVRIHWIVFLILIFIGFNVYG